MTKKVALALQAMVRAQYAQDSLRMVGFYTFASVMTERQLLNSAPKPVSIYDSRVRMRFDLDTPPRRVPQHFTNIHAGLRLARSLLARPGRPEQADHRDHRRRADGAHRGARGRLDLPAIRAHRPRHAGRSKAAAPNSGIRVSSFALIEDYFYTGLVNFVEEMARSLARGGRILLDRRSRPDRFR